MGFGHRLESTAATLLSILVASLALSCSSGPSQTAPAGSGSDPNTASKIHIGTLEPDPHEEAIALKGRLAARPLFQAEGYKLISAGLHAVGIDEKRDTQLLVPRSYQPDKQFPLLVLLHGAGGDGHFINFLSQFAEERGLIILAPSSTRGTWEMIRGKYGPDSSRISRALRLVFSNLNIDPARIWVGGFSDGGTYALSLGQTNGDLFSKIVAFSPGFQNPASRIGKPKIYVSHGTEDKVLPIHVCSRKITARLKSLDYNLLYREFNGSHEVPSVIVDEAMEFLFSE